MHILVRNAGNISLKLIHFTSFQILLIVPKLSPLTNINALLSAEVNICFNIAMYVACQYYTNSFDKELSFVFYRTKKYHFQQNLLLLMVMVLPPGGAPILQTCIMFFFLIFIQV